MLSGPRGLREGSPISLMSSDKEVEQKVSSWSGSGTSHSKSRVGWLCSFLPLQSYPPPVWPSLLTLMVILVPKVPRRGVCMFRSRLHGFSPSTLVFHQQSKDVPIKLIRDSKLPLGMSVWGNYVCVRWDGLQHAPSRSQEQITLNWILINYFGLPERPKWKWWLKNPNVIKIH